MWSDWYINKNKKDNYKTFEAKWKQKFVKKIKKFSEKFEKIKKKISERLIKSW